MLISCLLECFMPQKTVPKAKQITFLNRLLAGFRQWKFGWVIRCDSMDGTQWKSEIEFIKATHERLVDAVMNFDPGMLDQPVGKKTIINAIEFIHGIAEHSLYHTAQMEMTKTFAKHNGIE